jgi:hypothetical protein
VSESFPNRRALALTSGFGTYFGEVLLSRLMGRLRDAILLHGEPRLGCMPTLGQTHGSNLAQRRRRWCNVISGGQLSRTGTMQVPTPTEV